MEPLLFFFGQVLEEPRLKRSVLKEDLAPSIQKGAVLEKKPQAGADSRPRQKSELGQKR